MVSFGELDGATFVAVMQAYDSRDNWWLDHKTPGSFAIGLAKSFWPSLTTTQQHRVAVAMEESGYVQHSDGEA